MNSYCFAGQILFAVLLIFIPAKLNFADNNPLNLWYDEPADKWVEALPIGNGRLGAMVFGRTDTERIQFNEDTFWAGRPYSGTRKNACKYLPRIRKLIFEDTRQSFKKAHNLINREFMGKHNEHSYQPAGNLLLDFDNRGKVSDYKRELDIGKALAKVSYKQGGTEYEREIFSSSVDQVTVMKISSDKQAGLDFDVRFTCPQKEYSITADGNNALILTVRAKEEHNVAPVLRCVSKVKIRTDGGNVNTGNGKILVRSANTAEIYLTSATNFIRYNKVNGEPEKKVDKCIANAIEKSYQQIKSDHIAKYRKLFDRVHIELGNGDFEELTTDKRIKGFADRNDPDLAELYFQFGRYLLISSSLPGTQPANLQGLWNENINPPWNSNYTTNINTEMNYWLAESTNLSECHNPLFGLIKDLSESGRKPAEEYYNAEGWVLHHNTDLWRSAVPFDGASWGIWPTGGAWLCQHLWYRYEYSLDKDFLEWAYPIMKSSSQFFLDTLVEEPEHGWLVTCPSLSPENARLPGGISICAGPTMDNQIIRDLFEHCIQASRILDKDEKFRKKIQNKLEKLAPMQIGEQGQLQEWLDDIDLEVPHLHHRHVSHLYGLFPSDQITAWDTPELFDAAEKTLQLRGDGGTGWSKAWKINFRAHLHDGDHAFKMLETLISTGTYPNMFDAHPPFQIDGNFGGTSGITEMLMQSYAAVKGDELSALIHLLGALPSVWEEGSVSGLRARGGFEVDISWENGELKNTEIRSLKGGKVTLRYKGKEKKFSTELGEIIKWNGK